MTRIHITTIYDPELGAIAACMDEDGRIIATAADTPPTNHQPYADAVDALTDEEAELYASAHPIEPELWRRAVINEWRDEA